MAKMEDMKVRVRVIGPDGEPEDKPSVGFNSEFTQVVMEAVFAERRRQIKLGRERRIPWACEDPATTNDYRLGVLGEEFGEVCKAIIEHEGLRCEFEEYVQVAAVAIACAEAAARDLGLDPGDLPAMAPQQAPRPATVAPATDGTPDPHLGVLLRAHAIYRTRNHKYKDTWKNYGWKGCMVHLRTCVERAWRIVIPSRNNDINVDNLLDAINYAAFAIQCIEENNPDGVWEWS